MINLIPVIKLTFADGIFCFLYVFFCTLLYHRCNAPEKILMLFGSDNALLFQNKMNARSDLYRVAKIVDTRSPFHINILKEIEQYDAVVLNDIPFDMRNELSKYCYRKRIRLYVVPSISDLIIGGGEKITLFDNPLILVKNNGLSASQKFIKRFFDINICLIVLIPAIIIFLVIALAIKIEDGGPILYKQKRVTKDEKTFNIIKIRSMNVDAEKAGYDLTLRATEKDTRVTAVGRIIRPCRLDELPQLFNILKGDMSIVGPRPERIENHLAYCKEVPEFVYRTTVKAGLTGYAQIYGKYNTSAYDKLKMDLIYIENYSLLTDLKLILMTPQTLLNKESTEGFKKTENNEQGKATNC